MDTEHIGGRQDGFACQGARTEMSGSHPPSFSIFVRLRAFLPKSVAANEEALLSRRCHIPTDILSHQARVAIPTIILPARSR
jgi:hypothetical protein